MRKPALLIVFLILFVSSAFAQQKNAFSVFYSNTSAWFSSASGFHVEGGPGMSMSHSFSPVFSTELSVARENYTLFRSRGLVNGVPAFDRTNVLMYPFDATARYHFINETRWKPYVGLGLRYVTTHEIGRGQFSPFRSFALDPEVNGGVIFQIRSRIGIVLDGKQLIGLHDLHSDPAFKASLGLNWRF